jgi:hypothetical protein
MAPRPRKGFRPTPVPRYCYHCDNLGSSHLLSPDQMCLYCYNGLESIAITIGIVMMVVGFMWHWLN